MKPCIQCGVSIANDKFKSQDGVCNICIREEKIKNASGWSSSYNDPVLFETGQRG